MKPPVQFPAGVYADIHSVRGETFLAYARGGTDGMVAYRFPDGAPNPNAPPEWKDAQVGKGHARLTSFSDLVLLAYERQINEQAITRVVHALSGQRAANWEIESDGGQSCWGPGGLFSLQDRSQRVLVGPWPDKPRADSPLSRQGNAGGVSRFDGDHVVLVTDEALGYPDWSDDGSAVVSQAQDGGIAMSIVSGVSGVSNVSGVLLPGRNTLAPRVTRQTNNGKYSACFYDVDSHGSTGVYVVTDIEQADLTAAPPAPLPNVESVVKPNRPFALGYYSFNDAPFVPANLVLPIRPSLAFLEALIAAKVSILCPSEFLHRVPDELLWAVWCDSTHANPADTIKALRLLADARRRSLVCYDDGGVDLSLLATTDLYSPKLYREANESRADFTARMKAVPTDRPLLPSVNWHGRWNERGPTLTPVEVCEGIVDASTVAANWRGMLGFRVGTVDFVRESEPYLVRLRTGVTGLPSVELTPAPQPPTPVPPQPTPVPVRRAFPQARYLR